MKRIMFLSFLLFMGIGTMLYSQTIEVQNTYEITGKAKRGALGHVEYDQASGVYTLVYVTKSNEKKAKFQVYTFDRDFKFLNMVEDEIEFDKAKTKYTWFKYNGELYSVTGNYVEPNLVGTLVLKKKKITYKYDWLLLGYYKTVEILEKVKPKTDDGRKLFYLKHAEDDRTGDIYVLCGVKANMKDAKDDNAAAYRHQMDIHLLKFNADLDIVGDIPVKFDFPQQVAFGTTITKMYEDDPDNPGISGIVFVTVPMGGPGMNKFADPKMNNYTYLRFNTEGTPSLKERISFESPAIYWRMDEMVVADDAVYIFGVSAPGKEKYYNMITNVTKFKGVQLMKIAGGKVEYLTETTLEDFAAKVKFPPSQKKIEAYEGKRFHFANYYVSDNGDFFVLGQKFDEAKEGNKYKDVLTFHFDNKGVLKSQYAVDLLESNQYSKAAGCPQDLIEGNKSMYWLMMEIKGVTMWNPKPLTYPRIGKIDINTGTISDPAAFGKIEKADYYLDPKFPFLQTDGGNKIVFFGSDKSGKTIWFCRVAL
ncbi:MAG: hypothetical protein CVU05_00335 [Bacteroidetes bacterium HGW-Bacteroidetes-21]|jgi:hypothetical protein|nr:MAG: hypothetical protein CVU05_00335 [Bacteroidetes bacterium HGW-Bacteroidetes-21]